MNKLICSLMLLSFSSCTPVFAAPKDGREVMATYEKNSKQLLITSDATMTNKESDGSAKLKKFTWWRKLGEDGQRYKTLTKFKEPAEIRGEEILFVEKDGGEADVLMYLPAYKKTRRVEKQAHSKSFMSSEFSYADIATPHLDDFTYKLAPDDEGRHVIELTPKSDEVRERIGYSRISYWMYADNGMIAKAEYTDLAGKLLKRLQTAETEEVDKANHRFMSRRLEMENLTNGRKTTIEFEKVDTKTPIAESKFAAQNLGRN